MRRPIILANATWQAILGLKRLHLAAVLRGDMDDAQMIREQILAHMDAYLDHQTEAAVAAELKAKG
ncbi:hypothetical protein [Brucella intermedia]|uniref:hypothetical protein n=1 Tax=Brucella intermedia TaxID=94625 RepID=UPI000DD575C8|nr:MULTISPECIES: hypothetical protein [Brucella/Ochrobactrum group]WGG60508.1 hypothetical protein QA414_06265 [Brucella intermedia]